MPHTVDDVLQAAVAQLGGSPRAGQQQMSTAVADTIASGKHLLVQAGTGTGKSLGYLVPLLTRLAASPGKRALVATATLALQHQLASKDIPLAVDAVARVTGRTVPTAVVMGRSNYACLLKVRGAAQEQEALLGSDEVAASLERSGADAASVTGAQVVALRDWAEQQGETGGLAMRDDAPSHSAQAWAQVSVPVRECVGAERCPFGDECFVEASRQRARASQLIVTNHALLAIDAMHGGTALPEYESLVVDEAHELTGRVTSAATSDLIPSVVERTANRALPHVSDAVGEALLVAIDDLREALSEAPTRQLGEHDGMVIEPLTALRDAARTTLTALTDGESSLERSQVSGAVQEVFDVADRMAALKAHDVVWVSDSPALGPHVVVAPLSVAGLMSDRVLDQHPTVLTSATLKVGGDFTAAAAAVGLGGGDEGDTWRGLDVGSPFHHRTQGIVYVASSLPPPGRDGIGPEALAQTAELVWAAGGRTLGLFASTRSARAAAEHVRRELPAHTVLCQGDGHLPDLVRRFVAEEESSLFGTLSLWQGVDVPGATCSLVIIDKIPFPRPDDPLMQARQKAVQDSGGNGFMQVAAHHAGLLLAQGAGRLLRRDSDRGVVAILDPRVVTARYGNYLRASLPPLWPTTTLEVAVAALQRLRETSETAQD